MSQSNLTLLNALLKHSKGYLKQHIAVRAGIDTELIALDGTYVLVDELEDRFIARLKVTKQEIAKSVVRDLIVVEAIMEAFRALWCEPDWSPYP